ncbi:enolase family protein [Tritrichomonas foetus]|uniref:phosphopyruvate hydratase n=1 Tax=Tritrichomonas foetus TaxID=1144522 RepID=A0A1J4JAY4_9EUKA|nr:enolase family protein [Tritrichomonas foetus]|eukprot:OHS96346.1 enolase family protein [Tritrichomonas foetus]
MTEFTKEQLDIINKCYKNTVSHPTDDPIGQLSRYLNQYSNKPTVAYLVGREVLDSRGNPTVETDVYVRFQGRVEFGGRSSAPSGASTGSNEARELRDSDKNRYGGKGTSKAAHNVTSILSPALKGMKLTSLMSLDNKICDTDGTELKERVGGNAVTATSFALATAAAKYEKVELFEYLARQFYGPNKVPKKFRLPTPCFNILNGGKHAGGHLKIQEFMVRPSKKYQFPDQLRIISEVYTTLSKLLTAKYGVSAKNLGDEGGFAPKLETPEEALTCIETAIQRAGYKPGTDVEICLDAAASEFYNRETKLYEVEVGLFKTGDQLIEYWADLIKRHPAVKSIEDGLDENDYENWIKLNSALGRKIQLVGDDLYTTNPKTIARGLREKWCNALLLKVNQIGTITEAMEAAKMALDARQNVIVSHRSGETCNSLISDLAVAIGAQQIKAGSTARGERIEKYTRLLQIYEYLKANKMLA